MKAKVILSALLILCAGFTAKAQFYSYGNDRGSLKWSQIQTRTYRVVYPRGLDSLARVYALNLEKVAAPVSGSIGYRPNEAFRKKMPVILHPYSASANGMVSLVPRRMELLTNPEMYGTEVLPWVQDLCIHESRHVSQLQFAREGGWRFWNVLIGEFGAGALSAIYCGPAFFEGDAVMAETALTGAGRGRSADFLEYMRASFSEGQYRDYWKWRYGSQNRYTPDYYKVGYITMAGMSTMFGEPDFTKRYYQRLDAHHGVAFNNFQKTVRDVSGMKFKDAFSRICENLDSTWRADALSRGPFTQAQAVTSDKRLHTEYSSLQEYGNSILALRKGISETASLVRIWPDGSEEKLRGFASTTSTLHVNPDDGRVYWTEYRRDPRWSLESYSDVRFLDPEGKVRTLTKGHRYFNPAPCGTVVAVVELLPDGSQTVTVLDSGTGEAIEVTGVPDGLQAVETAWLGGRLYVSAISEEGSGIYQVSDFKRIFAAGKVKIKRLSACAERLVFLSDLNGVDEIYSLEPASGEFLQLTSSPNGTGDFAFAADTLYFTTLHSTGRNVFKTPQSSLLFRPAIPSDNYRYEMADKLSGDEKIPVPESFSTPVSGPSDYSKLGHAVKIHSWLPLYFNCDDVSSLSFETIYQSAGLGATAFFQNELSTLSGLAGIKVDPSSGWRPSGHLKLTWSGLYPVLEAQVDFNDRLAQETEIKLNEGNEISMDTVPVEGKPRVYASLKAYIPLNFSSGGWNRGLVPQLNLAVSNDSRTFDGKSVNSSYFTASLRAYTMRDIPSSCIYPRPGIGAEAGYAARPGFSDVFCANAYAFLYGYLPGLTDTHGIKLTASLQKHVSDGFLCETHMKTTPRGFSNLSASYMSAYPLQSKFTVDYALPFAPVDWSWMCPVTYVRNFELALHADGAWYKASRSSTSLFSVGADLTAHLGNFLWIPYDTRIGVEYEYLGGAGFGALQEGGRETVPHSVGLLFSIDF